MKISEIKEKLAIAKINASEELIATELKVLGLKESDIEDGTIGVLVGHFQAKSKELQLSSNSQDNALSLRSNLANGSIQPSDLNRDQIQSILTNIDAEAAQGKDLDDGTIALFFELSDQVAQLDRLTQMAYFAAEAVQEKRSGFQSAVSNLVAVVNDGLKQDQSTAQELKEVNAAIGGVFRSRNTRMQSELDSIFANFGK